MKGDDMTTTSPFHPYDNLTDWSDARSLQQAAEVTAWKTGEDIKTWIAANLPSSMVCITRPGDEYPCALGIAQALMGELVGIIERQTRPAADLDAIADRAWASLQYKGLTDHA